MTGMGKHRVPSYEKQVQHLLHEKREWRKKFDKADMLYYVELKTNQELRAQRRALIFILSLSLISNGLFLAFNSF